MREKTYDELEFTDDFLFCNILIENEDLCIELVEMTTGRKVKSIVKPEDQKSIRLTYDGKGVRLDVYFEDEDNVIYDIEMQTTRKYNLRKRSRYYQGMIDLNILSKGADYNRLKEAYIIFICTFDDLETADTFIHLRMYAGKTLRSDLMMAHIRYFSVQAGIRMTAQRR